MTIDILKNKIELLEEDLDCIHMYLDEVGAPVYYETEKLSIVGRIKHLLEDEHE